MDGATYAAIPDEGLSERHAWGGTDYAAGSWKCQMTSVGRALATRAANGR